MSKKVLLTGDSKGLGQNIRNLLEINNFKVVGISRNSEDIKFDLKNVNEIKDLYLKKIKELGPFYGFVNNAAFAYDDLATNINIEKLKYMFDINVFSSMILTKYLIRDMLLNNIKGSIVHISSVSVHTGYKGLSMYAATKGAMEAFSKNISREWGRLGIRSNIVCPGFMDTEMSSSLNEEQKNKIFKRNSFLKELKIEDVANTVEYLLSNKSKGITGEVIKVDNGTI
jgi:3-oxoacyl-[acyl-carrier protein] reductase